MKFSFTLPAAFAAMIVGASIATADDVPSALVEAPPASATPRMRVLAFGDGTTRFHVERDAAAGRMTFQSVDPATRFDQPPVVLMTTDAGEREVTLVPVAGRPGVWTWTHDAVKSEQFYGSMRVMVAGKTHTAPLSRVWTQDSMWRARYGGRVLALPNCGASVEVVQDPWTGTLTIYSFDDVMVTEAPVITVTESSVPTTVSARRVDGSHGVWMVQHNAFKTKTTTARIRLLVNGVACEAPLAYGTDRGGRVVSVSGGPNFEVVRDDDAGHYTFYALDETVYGKPYTLESPTVIVDGRTYPLQRVPNEPRAWRLVGLDNAGSTERNAQLNLTLFGKTLSTRLGLSGLGIGVR